MNRRRTEAELAPGFDALAASAVDVDRFCSSSTWVVPAHEAFHAETEVLSTVEDGVGLAFARGHSEAIGHYLSPLEGVWGLGSPVVTAQPLEGALAALRLLDGLCAYPETRVGAAMILGLRSRSLLFHALTAAFQSRYRVRGTATTTRYVASLEGGWDGYLARRTRKFRANLRRARRRAAEAGVRFESRLLESVGDVDREFPRVLEVERSSWKSAAGNGVAEGPMVTFTLGVLRRAAQRGGALLVTARHGDVDIGYLHGALDRGYFRGLQMSFDDAHRALGLGSLMQAEAIELLCASGAHSYDLGSELPYKLRWAEQQVATTGLVIFT